MVIMRIMMIIIIIIIMIYNHNIMLASRGPRGTFRQV